MSLSAVSIVDPWSVEFVNSLIKEFRADWEALLSERLSRRADPRGQLQVLMSMPVADVVIDPLWRCNEPPRDLRERRVEIVGPAVDPRIAIDAMNSGASGYIADGEDSLCPTWSNVHRTQRHVWALARGALQVEDNGTFFRLASKRATLHYRPRGLHMVDVSWKPGHREPACLIDVGLFVYHNARALLDRGSGPYLYLPKLETEHEARFWYRVASWMEGRLNLPKCSVRYTVLVETLPALLRLEPIVYALRKRLVGLSAGRWDYIFSCIKTLSSEGYVLPDRRELTSWQPQLVEYARWIVNVARRRGTIALGCAVLAEEVELGYDGTLVTSVDEVGAAMEVFGGSVGSRSSVGPDNLNVKLATLPMSGEVTWAGAREAARSLLIYFGAWMGGIGRVNVDGKIEDMAVVEVSRALLWSWVRMGQLPRAAVETVIRGEEAALAAAGTEPRRDVVEMLLRSIFTPSPPEFITNPAYDVVVSAAKSFEVR